MPGVRRVLPMIAALAVAIVVASCGGSTQTTPTVASALATELLAPLNAAQQAAAAGDCATVQAEAAHFQDLVNGIGADQVDPAIKQQLQSASASLKDLAKTDCTPPDTGASGAVGAVAPKAPKPGEATSTDQSTTESTTSDPAVAAKPEKPAKGAKQQAKAKADPAAKPKKQKRPKKQKKHGSSGPAGPPSAGGQSGGVTPGQGD